MTAQFFPAAFAAVLLVAPAAEARARHTLDRAALDQLLPPAMAASKIPSVSIAVIKHGRVVLTTAYGFQSDGVRATPRTLYNIASLSKPLSAEVLLRLASRGVISLDAPMAPTFVDSDIASDPRAKQLTVRFALSHRTGFPNWRDRQSGLKFVRDPGGQPGYSGEGYNYAAHYAEKASGKAFETLAQTYLFTPAGMTSTAYTGRPWFAGRIAVPTDGTGKALEPYVAKHFNAADLVYTTAGDYAAFMTGVAKNQGLSPAIARERNRVQVSTLPGLCRPPTINSACPLDDGFGLGWEVMEFKSGAVFMHTGKDEGLFTFAYLDRATGDGVVILTNSDNGAGAVMPVLEATHANPAFVAYLKAQMG